MSVDRSPAKATRPSDRARRKHPNASSSPCQPNIVVLRRSGPGYPERRSGEPATGNAMSEDCETVQAVGIWMADDCR